MINVKDTLAVDHPCPKTKFVSTEKWLKDMAKSGWKLTQKNGSSFYFRKCNPYDTDYFIYEAFNANKGIYFDYYMAKKLYAKANAEINIRSFEIFEADINKIDDKYYEYKALRNTYYKEHYASMSLLFGTMFVLYTIIGFSAPTALLLSLPLLLLFAYNFYSYVCFAKETS